MENREGNVANESEVGESAYDRLYNKVKANRLARGESMHISEKEQQVNPTLGIPRTPRAQHRGKMVKSPSDTTLYKPAMKKGVESELVNRISNFVENIRIETAASPNVAKHTQARSRETDLGPSTSNQSEAGQHGEDPQ